MSQEVAENIKGEIKEDPDKNSKKPFKDNLPVLTETNGKTSKEKTLYVRKISPEEKSKNEISTEIDCFFNLPDKYFSDNSPISVGKKIELKDLNSLKLVKKGRSSIAERASICKMMVSSKTSSNDKFLYIDQLNKQSNILTKYEELIDNDKLNNLFTSFKKKNQKKSFIEEDYNIKKRLPFDISKSLIVQNKKLNDKSFTEKKFKKMSRYLSRKINKNEKELLFNNIDSFRFKKEIINAIENNKPLDERYGAFNWNITLRNSENFKGVKETYLNLKKKEEPLWARVIEKFPKIKELSIKPGYDLTNKNYIDFRKNRFFHSKNSNRLKTVENLDNINIKGQNLYNIEYTREMSSQKKKILHKVFVENGKVILNKDINDVFGNETIYKNYNKMKNPNSFLYNGNKSSVLSDSEENKEKTIIKINKK